MDIDIDALRSFTEVDDTYPSSYSPIPQDQTGHIQTNHRRPIKGFLVIFSSILFLSLLILLIGQQKPDNNDNQSPIKIEEASNSLLIPSSSSSSSSKGLTPEELGVSDKSSGLNSGGESTYPWTNVMLSWQRTGYHFQPQKNYMNDPDGPLFYKGWYHLFYQYNPDGAIWGNIVWGHAVSKDLIHWLYLPIAMVRDQWYDINGAWTGSATLLPDGSIVMIYTGSTKDQVQVQNVAFPANLSDPLLIDWVKYSGNPVLYPPPGIGLKDFRDPTTAWYGPDSRWRLTIGTKVGTTGTTLVYETTNFLNYTLLDNFLHEVPGTGMWECIDFYPVSTTVDNGLDTSVNGPGVKHVLKASMDDTRKDYYALGTYDLVANTWTPDDPELDVGIGLRYDYGKYYASKSFYDQSTKRRILWSWIGETDSVNADIKKGWASVQGIPRVVVFDSKTKTNLLQWPVEEVESLRASKQTLENIDIEAGSVLPIKIGSAAQLDITAEFEINEEVLNGLIEADVVYNCSTSGGAAARGKLGPFGLLVLADESLSEQTAVYFYIAKGIDGNLKTFFCADESRSSKANDIVKPVYGSIVPVLSGEKLSLRILVDHSIVESFAQRGRTCITSRVYPTKAIDGAARLFLFNNATGGSVTLTSLNVWEMNSAFIRPFYDQ